MDFDATVKLALYDAIADTARMPTSHDLARLLGVRTDEVEGAFARLHEKRLLVPEPGDQSRVRMAPPFSGITTDFPVVIGKKRFFANCVWDAFGIAAALHSDAIIDASDGHTGEPLTLEVRGGGPVPQDYVVHFAVPAALWWRDVIYT
jgi:hypothetical protein